MGFLVITCPHCATPLAPLKLVATKRRIGEGSAIGFFVCPVCDKPVGAWLARQNHVSGAGTPEELVKWGQTIEAGGWGALAVWPPPQETRVPEDVPDKIGRNFLQAEEAARRGHRESAGMTYRRALELAIKDKGPELTGVLAKRIDQLASAGTLTPDIAEWAHSIRDLGNEAAHDEEEPTDEDIADLAAFTRVVLEYLYTMPAKVARRAAPPNHLEEA